MLFHAFRVVYTGKEFDSHAKHGQSFKKKIWTYNRVFLCQKSHFRIRTSFGEFFSIVVLYDVTTVELLIWHFSGKNASVHASSRVRARGSAHQRGSIGRLSARASLGKNVSKEVCFWLWGKDNLVQLPKQPTVTWTVDIVVFPGQQWSFSSVLLTNVFINKAQFDAGFAHRLILKDGAVPAIKDPGHDSELQMVSETASNDCFVGNRSKCSSLFSSAHTARLQELGFFRRGS